MNIRQLGVLSNEGIQVGSFRNAYHPERHYMRGPGPKWHAKHTASLVAAASVQPVASANGRRGRALSARNAMVTWLVPTAAAAVLGFVAVMVFA
jgi:hypothetical protein